MKVTIFRIDQGQPPRAAMRTFAAVIGLTALWTAAIVSPASANSNSLLESLWVSPPSSEGTLSWESHVEWSGGPLNGTATGVNATGDQSLCPEDACDDFLLNIDISPSPRDDEVRYAQITLESSDPSLVDLVVIPPVGSQLLDATEYDKDTVRLLAPEAGTWLIRARCGGGTPPASSAQPCVGVTYTGEASTGSLTIPPVVAHRPGAVDTSASPRGKPQVQVSRVGANAFEPTLGVDEAGAVFFQAWGGARHAPKVLRSDDQGRSWINISPRDAELYRHPASGDPYLYLDETTGRMFTVDLIPPALECVEHSFSDDGGQAWTTSSTCGITMDHQMVFAGPPVASSPVGYANVVYICANSFATLATACMKSLDGGFSYVPTGAPIFVEGVECAGMTGHGVSGPDGTIFIPRGCGNPKLAISRDEGTTWEVVQVSDNGTRDHEAAVAVDANGTLYYSWIASDLLPYLAISSDGGVSWTEPMMIAPPGLKEAVLPGMDVGDPGSVAIVYAGSETGKTWNGYVTVSTTVLDKKPVFYTGVVNDPTDPISLVCDGGAISITCEGAGEFFDVVVAPDGTAWAAFADGCVVDRCTADQYGGDGFVARVVGVPLIKETQTR